MKMKMKTCFSVSSVLIMLFILGCGGPKNLSGLVPGEGVITLNGEKLEGATITFSPEKSDGTSRSAGASSENDGKFKITTLNPEDGIYPGEYTVTVQKFILLGPEPTEEQIREASDKSIDLPFREMKSMIPVKYGKAETSGLKITIPATGDKNIEIALEGQAP